MTIGIMEAIDRIAVAVAAAATIITIAMIITNRIKTVDTIIGVAVGIIHGDNQTIIVAVDVKDDSLHLAIIPQSGSLYAFSRDYNLIKIPTRNTYKNDQQLFDSRVR